MTLAMGLQPGQELKGKQTLTGVVSSIKTPYSAQYGNISVYIQVTAASNQEILCYRLTAESEEAVVVGDTITVTGQIINYNGTIEFTQGCTYTE